MQPMQDSNESIPYEELRERNIEENNRRLAEVLGPEDHIFMCVIHVFSHI
jgi:hypothetical protein